MQEGVDGLLRDKTRPAWPRAARCRDHRAGRRPDGPRSAGRDDPLDRRHDGQDHRHQRVLGAAIWQAHGTARVRRFKLSKDPEFVPKLRAIVGLYVNPPAHAIVLSVDEKSQIQALDRTQPGLPIKKGRAAR